jgi:hypothetical protein
MFGRVRVGRRLGGVQGVVHSGTRERDPDAGPGTQAFSVIATLSRVCTPKFVDLLSGLVLPRAACSAKTGVLPAVRASEVGSSGKHSFRTPPV